MTETAILCETCANLFHAKSKSILEGLPYVENAECLVSPTFFEKMWHKNVIDGLPEIFSCTKYTYVSRGPRTDGNS